MTEKKYDVAFIAEAPMRSSGILTIESGDRNETITPVHTEGLNVLYGNEHDIDWLRHQLWTDFHSKREPWQKGEIIEVMERTRRMGFHKEAEEMEDDIRSEFGPVENENEDL